MKRNVRVVLALSASAMLLFTLGGAASAGKQERRPVRDAATGALKPAKLVEHTPSGATIVKQAPFLSDATIATAQEALGINARDERLEGADAAGGVEVPDLGEGRGTLGCSNRDRAKGNKGNVRVNQDCTFRRQAEEDIVYNPADPKNLLAGQNDSRVGFNQCGFDWSTDGGKHWGDGLPPFRQKLNSPESLEPTPTDPNRHTIRGGPGTLHTYDAGSDPSPAFDSEGRGYFSCVAFDFGSNASLLYVTQSPKGAQGSFFFNLTSLGRHFIVAEDNSPEIFHDKEFVVADRYGSSPNKDNVYVTWTVFEFNDRCVSDDNPSGQCSSPIYGSMSTDHAATWSTPEEISGSSKTLCFFGDLLDPNRDPSSCDNNQGSDPEVLHNGELEVIFNNGNTAADNPNAQQLGVHCRPTGSSPAGTAHLNCDAPVKVGDDVIAGEPQCDFGRGPEECIPGPFIRTNDFPRIAVATDNGHLYATWQDYRNGEYDIQLARSLDGGTTWEPSKTVNPDTGLDHYFPAVDVAEIGGSSDRVGVSYFRSERVPSENTIPEGGFAPGQPGVGTGNSDYVLAGNRDLDVPYDFKVMSPVFPPPDGAQAGFNGDYSGLTINRGNDAFPIWSDTRNVDPYAPANGVTHDEDVFTERTNLPEGTGKAGPGTLGERR